jgi:hypothetical protein
VKVVPQFVQVAQFTVDTIGGKSKFSIWMRTDGSRPSAPRACECQHAAVLGMIRTEQNQHTFRSSLQNESL